jgi:Caudovirus prohead serine protease
MHETRIYLPIAKVDVAQRMVYGYASTEARDDQGEVVKRDALQSALGNYMKFGNIREMHQLSAVGKAKNAEIDEKGLYLGAKVVDDAAWNKVVEGVYGGFSIGGKVTTRDPADYKTITGLRLDEISLVDRPANPEAVFDCWKRSTMVDAAEAGVATSIVLLRQAIERAEALIKGGDEPGDGSKPYGEVAYADPGYQDDKKKRYPIDSEKHIRAAWNYINKPKNAGKYSAEQVKHIKSKIIAAWQDKIDPEGPPSADDEAKAARVELKKHLYDVGAVAQIILQLDWLKDALATEAIVEGDDSEQPKRLEAIVDELCAFLNSLVAEETAEIKSDSEDMGPDGGMDAALMSAVATSLRKSALPGRAKLFEGLAKAKHSMGDQALLDCAHMAVDKCMKIDGLKAEERDHMGKCADALKAAGARDWSAETGGSVEATQNTAGGASHSAPTASPPAQEYRPGEYTTWNSANPAPEKAGDTAKVLELITDALGKRGKAHQALMDVAHDCIGKACDGGCCKAENAGGRHSKETMGHLQEAHDHLTAAGAKCAAAGQMDGAGPDAKPGAEEEDQGTEFEGKTIRLGDLKKLASERGARTDALSKAVAEMTPRLDAILKTVEKIEKAPLPPLTRSTAGLARVEKGSTGDETDEALMTRIARMSPDEQAMLLIKASRMRPMKQAPGMPGTEPAAE